MTDKDYEQKRRECWEEFCEAYPAISLKATVRTIFNFAFKRAYALGKQENDAEGEEILTVPRGKAIEVFQYFNGGMQRYYFAIILNKLKTLFGSKCLPDKEPKPAEPKFKVGDAVKIKTNAANYHQGYQNGYSWLPERDKYVGKSTYITAINTNGTIELEISGEKIRWNEVDIELNTEPILQPFSQVKETATSIISNTSTLNDALLKLEEASKQVREELTKLNNI